MDYTCAKIEKSKRDKFFYKAVHQEYKSMQETIYSDNNYIWKF